MCTPEHIIAGWQTCLLSCLQLAVLNSRLSIFACAALLVTQQCRDVAGSILTGQSCTDWICPHCRQEQLLQHKEQEFAIANEAMLAGFMDRINQIADAVGQNQLVHPDNTDFASKLRLAVHDLQDVSLSFYNNQVHVSVQKRPWPCLT